jgi:hypothetical protein
MIGLLFAAALAAAPIRIDGVERQPLPDFRERYPAPASAAEAKALWDRIDAAYRRDAADGASAKVTVRYPGGMLHGEDHYRFDPVPALRELRSGSETLAEGDRACSRTPPAGDWQCGPTEVDYGLPRIDWDALLVAEISEVECGAARCVRVRLMTATFTDYVADDEAPVRLYAMPPNRNTRVHQLTAELGSLRLRSTKALETVDGKPRTLASYEYDVDARIDPIVLPD